MISNMLVGGGYHQLVVFPSPSNRIPGVEDMH